MQDRQVPLIFGRSSPSINALAYCLCRNSSSAVRSAAFSCSSSRQRRNTVKGFRIPRASFLFFTWFVRF
uniref:Uncharacterized protein n=1 Tax=Siphoviridae sp. ctEqU3 TaxID=2825399 RepID=A0A8S5P333_9CAUD|nr:MAG TPA: hypothetical protein [Siphoviridae sp. ctEqU3]